jgi:hypothetical protein
MITGQLTSAFAFIAKDNISGPSHDYHALPNHRSHQSIEPTFCLSITASYAAQPSISLISPVSQPVSSRALSEILATSAPCPAASGLDMRS